jgi:peptide/nickel transport system permease protein
LYLQQEQGLLQQVIRKMRKNSLNPVVTAISGWFALMLAGAVFL